MFKITNLAIESEKLNNEMHDSRAGGFVCFEGWVRNHNEGKQVSSLEYEAFDELCISEAEVVLRECAERFKIFSISCVHRVGHLQLNEIAVWIGVTSAHRDEAFRACRYIIDEIKLRLPIWKKEHYTDGEAVWVDCKECYKHAHHYSSHTEENLYYQKQQLLKQVGYSGQKKLSKANVLVVGAGGLGCPVLQALTGAGVGTITVIEHDKLDISNLHRQSLYNFHDTGKQKAFLAQEALRKYNPFVNVKVCNEKLTFSNAHNKMQNIDVILDCTDNFETKLLIHDFSHQANIPLVSAAVYQMEGELQVFLNQNKNNSCMRCLWPEMPDSVQNCAESGVLGTTPAIIGQMQAKLAIDVLLGRKIDGRKIIVDIDSMDIEKINVPKNKNCWLCSNNEIKLAESMYSVPTCEWEIKSNNSKELEKYELIDIRNSSERETDKINKYTTQNIATEISDYQTLAKDKNYLLICQKGIRSYKLTKQLREKKLTHFYSLKAGLEGLKETCSK